MNKIKALKNILGNNTLKKTFNDDCFKILFPNNNLLGEYGQEIIEYLLNKEDEYLANIYLGEKLRIKFLSIIYNIIIRIDIENKNFDDNIFFLSVTITDRLISLLRFDINNEKDLELLNILFLKKI